jgi:hypothetical protein
MRAGLRRIGTGQIAGTRRTARDCREARPLRYAAGPGQGATTIRDHAGVSLQGG